MIEFGNNSYIFNTYSAAGEKLMTQYDFHMLPIQAPLSGNGETMETEGMSESGGLRSGSAIPIDTNHKYYCGNVVYDQGVTRLLTDEGYVTFSETGTPIYHYYLRDHLGNIRVVMGQTGAVEQVNHYYAFGGLMRESTNPGLQPYKYGGKEIDRFSGLDAYDFGARSYFADRMQWGSMDPLCEKYYSMSPYAYCGNNPVNYVDPDGKHVYTINEMGEIIKEGENDIIDLLVSYDGMNMALFSFGFLEQFVSERNNYEGHYGNTANLDDAVSLFMFAARNTNVEWAISSYFQRDGKLNYLVYTSNSDEGVTFTNGNYEFKNIKAHIHSHPRKDGNDKASGDYSQMYDSQKDIYRSFGSDDLSIINNIYSDYNKIYPNKDFQRDYPKFYIYNAKTNNFFRYDHLHPYIPVK